MPEHQGIKGTRQIKSIDAPDRHPTSATEGSMSVVAFDNHDTWYIWIHLWPPVSGKVSGIICNSQTWLKARWWFQPLWKILVCWDYYSQHMEKCSKSPTRGPCLMAFPLLTIWVEVHKTLQIDKGQQLSPWSFKHYFTFFHIVTISHIAPKKHVFVHRCPYWIVIVDDQQWIDHGLLINNGT